MLPLSFFVLVMELKRPLVWFRFGLRKFKLPGCENGGIEVAEAGSARLLLASSNWRVVRLANCGGGGRLCEGCGVHPLCVVVGTRIHVLAGNDEGEATEL